MWAVLPLLCAGAWLLGAPACGAAELAVNSLGDLSDPGIKPVSPALADGFFTTALPGKPVDQWRNTGKYQVIPVQTVNPFPHPLLPRVLETMFSNRVPCDVGVYKGV